MATKVCIDTLFVSCAYEARVINIIFKLVNSNSLRSSKVKHCLLPTQSGANARGCWLERPTNEFVDHANKVRLRRLLRADRSR